MGCAGVSRSIQSKSPPEGWKQRRSNLVENISAYYLSDDVPEEYRTGRCALLGQVDGQVDLVEGSIGDISVSIFIRRGRQHFPQTTNQREPNAVIPTAI